MYIICGLILMSNKEDAFLWRCSGLDATLMSNDVMLSSILILILSSILDVAYTLLKYMWLPE